MQSEAGEMREERLTPDSGLVVLPELEEQGEEEDELNYACCIS